MDAQVTIGDFSVMTRLSKKALRHYHDLGLLEPAHVDPHSGYRFYDTDQVDRAHIIRRFRELGTYVSERHIGHRGPIREHYLGGEPGTFRGFDSTEICWPVSATGTVSNA